MANKLKKFLKSFTLIELIIVIGIIAILSAAAFLLLTQWMSKSRDAQKISDLNVIQNALNIQITQADSLPIPDSFNTVTYTGEIVLYQGKFGSGVVSKITSLTKLPNDRTNGEYEYSLLSDRLTYKVQAIMENTSYKTTFVQGVFADELYYRYVGNDLRGIIVGNDFIYLPNMFLTGYVNGQYDLGSGMNVFLGSKVGEYVSGGILNKDYKDGIIAMMTGLGLSTDEALSIFIKVTGVRTSTSGTTETTQTEDSRWCYYASNELFNAHADWDITELKYDSANKKCHIFGDEDANSIAACNKWVTDNVTQGGEFVWVPARWYVTDGNGKSMKDSFYKREVKYNGKDYLCRGFAIAKYEMTYNDLTLNPGGSRNTYSYSTYGTSNGLFISKPGFPIGSISQTNSVIACKSLGSNYHLVTNNEWMTTSRNIELQGNNWTSGIVGSGGLFKGVSNNLTFGCDGNSYDGNRGIPSTINTCDRRIHSLSNNQQLWDMAGNLREHVDRGNNPLSITANDGDGNLCNGSGYWYSSSNPSSTCAVGYGPINHSGLVNNGLGYVSNSSGSTKVFIRGDRADAGNSAGIYSIYLLYGISSVNADLGFRCVW